jgi:hypothetical protein
MIGAVSLKIIPPTFSPAQGGSGKVVEREGSLLFEFAPAKANAAREYDWTKKVTFSLSATECGDVISMDVSDGKEFVHDPNMGSADAGLLMKKLKLIATNDAKGK